MEQFRQKIKLRFRLVLLLTFLTIAGIILLFIFKPMHSQSHLNSVMFGAQVGSLIGLIAVSLPMLFQYAKALKDINNLKRLFIKENDERTLMIRYKTNAIALQTIIVVIAIAIFISSYFNVYVFGTLLAVLYLVVIITTITKWYFNKKY